MKGRNWLGLILIVVLPLTALIILSDKPGADLPKQEDSLAPWFEDVTEKVGLDFVHDAGPVGSYFMPQIMGSGCALFDFDNDGRLDIYLLQNAGPGSSVKNRLYRQLPNGRFKDVSAGSGLDIPGYNMGVAIGDVNNDGWPDVLVTQYGGIKFFLNNRNGTFTDITKESGLENPSWGTSAAFVDYDRDGRLDLVVVNYVDYNPSREVLEGDKRDYPPPKRFLTTVSKLYRNLGQKPGAKPGVIRFQDMTLSSRLSTRPGPGLGVYCGDFNGDGWPDIFVANDGQANFLWINQHNGTFTEEGVDRGLAYNGVGEPAGNMGVAYGDADGKGLPALFVTHLTEENHTLWKQGPPGLFQDRSHAAGLTSSRGTGFGTVMCDFNNDGALDIAVVNGRVRRVARSATDSGLAPYWRPYAERNQLFANDGRGRFRDLSGLEKAFCGRPNVARGLACGDIDGDGAVDLLVTTIAGPARLYRNVAGQRGHWLMVRALLDKEHGARDAYGAEITVTAGKRRWVRWVNPGHSYLSSSDPRAHFGLGAVRQVDTIRVFWPDGSREKFAGRPADQVIVLRQGKGESIRK